MIHPTLYKRAVTGAVLEWFQESDGARYRTVAGQQDGAKVTSEWTVCTGKNIGRSNETTPEQQCELEVQANYTKKLNQGGYHEKVADIDKAKYFKPMLAKSLDDHPLTGIAFQRGIVYWQPKLDGIRSVMDDTGAWSRQGKPFLTVPHIQEAIREITSMDHRLDGELYNHLLKRDFNMITSLVKKQKASPEDMAKAASMIQYHVYDLPSCLGPFSERTEMLAELVKKIGHPSVVFVRTEKVTDQAHLDALTEEALLDDYEGGIVRINGGEYEQKRTKNLLKIKPFVDEEYPLISFEEGEGNWSGTAKMAWFRTPEGKEFKATMTGTKEYCAQVLKEREKYENGKGWATVKRSKDLTPDGKPRWGTIKALYDGKRDT